MGKKTVYVGAFPPPFGGVTVKNQLIYEFLKSKEQVVDFVDSKRSNGPQKILNTLLAVIKKDRKFYIGVSGKSMRLVSSLLYCFNRKSMNDSVLIVMGGTFAETVKNDAKYLKWVKGYKRVLVETKIMNEVLKSSGLENTFLFPNCRLRPHADIPSHEKPFNRVVFYSQIRPEKGVDLLLEAAKRMPFVRFDFWGEIIDSYRDEFMSSIESNENCQYNGVFKANGDNVYLLLSDYDVFVFPTRMQSEGVPGALIESKIAGIPAVVGNWKYNSELVDHDHDGMIMGEYSVDELVKCISTIIQDSVKFKQMKNNVKQSAERYYIDNYIDLFIDKR